MKRLRVFLAFCGLAVCFAAISSISQIPPRVAQAQVHNPPTYLAPNALRVPCPIGLGYNADAGVPVTCPDAGGWFPLPSGGIASADVDFGAYYIGGTTTTAAFGRTKFTNASTLTADSTTVIAATSSGTGTITALLCSDGITCGAGNVYLTCTIDCTGALGAIAACTVTKAAVPAGTTLTWGVPAVCAGSFVSNPGFNATAHATTP